MNNSPIRREYLWFTIAFAVVSSFLLFYMLLTKVSFIWQVDGLEEQYPFFVFEGQWLRELINNHNPQLWSHELGYGYDAFIFVSNTLGNPINLISYFVPERYAWIALNLTVPVTLYLAGLSFIWSVFRVMGNTDGSWIAALAYVYSGYSVLAFSQIFMLYPLILGPLLIVGIEGVFNKKYYFYPFVVFLIGIYGPMQTYILMLFAVIYCIIRLIASGKLNIVAFFKYVSKFTLLTLFGLAMSAVLMLPIIFVLTHMERLSIKRTYDMFYMLRYYYFLPLGLLGGAGVGADAYTGLGPMGYISIIILMVNRAQDIASRIIKTMSIVMIGILCIPFLGRVTNGFAYPNNRWVWLLSLLSAYAIVYLIRNKKYLDVRGWTIGVCTIIPSILAITDGMVTRAMLYVCLSMAGVYIIVTNVKSRWLLASCIVLSVIFSSMPMLMLMNYRDQLNPLVNPYKLMTAENPLSLAKSFTQTNREGIDGSKYNTYRNNSILLKQHGATFYSSYYNSYIDKYHNALGLSNSYLQFSFNGYEGRQVMESMGGIKYFVTSKEETTLQPSLFSVMTEKEHNDVTYQVLENNACLPTAFVPQQELSTRAFMKLSMSERQQALSKYLVHDNADNQTADGLGVLPMNYQMELGPGMSYENGILKTTIPYSQIHFNIPESKAKEVYIELYDFKYTDNEGRNTAAGVTVSHGTNHSWVWSAGTQGEAMHLFAGKTDWLVNVGNVPGKSTDIVITFDNTGTYNLRTPRIVAIDAEQTQSNLKSMQTNNVKKQVWSNNKFTAEYQSAGKALMLRIPYAEGWSAKVDGKPVKIVNADIGFMAVEVPQGNHKIVFDYNTPLLKEGAIVSMTSIILYIVWGIIRIVRRCDIKQIA